MVNLCLFFVMYECVTLNLNETLLYRIQSSTSLHVQLLPLDAQFSLLKKNTNLQTCIHAYI